MFNVCRNIEKDSTYGWTKDGTKEKDIDTHLMKNVECSACAYLAQSTTRNLYSIYDMSGGTWKRVTAYGSNLVNAYAKYKDVYIKNGDTQSENYSAVSSKVEDTVYETSLSGNNGSYFWYSEYSYMPYSDNLFFIVVATTATSEDFAWWLLVAYFSFFALFTQRFR